MQFSLWKIHNSKFRIDQWKRSELTKGKAMEKVRIDQEKRSELTKEFFFLRSELTNKKGSELTSGRGPN